MNKTSRDRFMYKPKQKRVRLRKVQKPSDLQNVVVY